MPGDNRIKPSSQVWKALEIVEQVPQHNSMVPTSSYESLGYQCFGFDEVLARWVQSAAAAAPDVLQDPTLSHWYRHRRTWFVGVDALPNNISGRLPDGPPLSGKALDFIAAHLGFTGPWHQAQLSVCFPGYPQQDAAETDGQYRFRLLRDAAHVDGLHGEGPPKRRHLREVHAFILGIPLNDTPPDAAPLVVWEKSHHIMQAMFRRELAKVAPEQWGNVDLTDAYAEARRKVLDVCERRVLHTAPGEATLLHPMVLHGVAPWPAAGASEHARRMIAYFRPEITASLGWLGLS